MPGTTQQEFRDSQNAISSYIAKYGNYSTRNVAAARGTRVLCSGSYDVNAKIETNYSFVEIFFNDQHIESTLYTRYDNRYQVFDYDDECLTITAKDRSGNDIEISIS